MKKNINWLPIPYDTSKRQAVLDLMALEEGHEADESEFIWWFERNPTKYINIFLAEYAGQIIAVSSANTFKIWCNGDEHLVPFLQNILTHPGYRGLGIFSQLEMKNEEDAKRQKCPFILGFPNRLITPIYLGKLDFSLGKVAPLMIKMANPSRLLSKVSGVESLKWVTKPINGLARLTFHKSLPENIQPIDGFDKTFDDLWEHVRKKRRWGLVRDSAYLNWRYIESPSARYRCFRIMDGAELGGYLVVGVIQKKELTFGYIADLFLRDESMHLESAALAAADSLFASQDLDAILCFAPLKLSERLKRMGFFYLPTPKHFTFIYKIFDPRFIGLPFGKADQWQFELGDLDFF